MTYGYIQTEFELLIKRLSHPQIIVNDATLNHCFSDSCPPGAALMMVQSINPEIDLETYWERVEPHVKLNASITSKALEALQAIHPVEFEGLTYLTHEKITTVHIRHIKADYYYPTGILEWDLAVTRELCKVRDFLLYCTSSHPARDIVFTSPLEHKKSTNLQEARARLKELMEKASIEILLQMLRTAKLQSDKIIWKGEDHLLSYFVILLARSLKIREREHWKFALRVFTLPVKELTISILKNGRSKLFNGNTLKPEFLYNPDVLRINAIMRYLLP